MTVHVLLGWQREGHTGAALRLRGAVRGRRALEVPVGGGGGGARSRGDDGGLGLHGHRRGVVRVVQGGLRGRATTLTEQYRMGPWKGKKQIMVIHLFRYYI
jgi:hypothetical protein